MKTIHRFVLLVALLIFSGCAEPVAPGPSYAELVVTYNAELETLERLETKREKLAAALASTTKDQSATTVSQLEGLIESAKGLKEGAASELPTNPEALLDHLTENSGEAHELAGQLFDGLLGDGQTATAEQTPEEVAAEAERRALIAAELATLDAELAKQKERVERARQARDTADSNRN